MDPDTARRGETIYGFCIRAAIQNTKEALEDEAKRLRKKGKSAWSLENDAVNSLVWLVVLLSIILALCGLLACTIIAAGFALARVLVEGFNYLQHYGLVREAGTPYNRRHAWGHLSPVVRAATVEITNHHHHHIHPDTRFYDVIPDPESPHMPSALACFFAALVPPLWEKYIAMPRLRYWDENFATEGERELAKKANKEAGWPEWKESNVAAVDVRINGEGSSGRGKQE